MSKVVRAKVATLIDDYQIALNAGSTDGVTVGSEVSLFRTVEIVDPDTKERLGSVDLRKVRLTINVVQERLSIARVTDRATSGDIFSSALLGGGSRNFVKLVKARPSGQIKSGDVPVSVGEAAEIEIVDSPDDDLPF